MGRRAGIRSLVRRDVAFRTMIAVVGAAFASLRSPRWRILVRCVGDFRLAHVRLFTIAEGCLSRPRVDAPAHDARRRRRVVARPLWHALDTARVTRWIRRGGSARGRAGAR
jgi:hypothetical protein